MKLSSQRPDSKNVGRLQTSASSSLARVQARIVEPALVYIKQYNCKHTGIKRKYIYFLYLPNMILIYALSKI